MFFNTAEKNTNEFALLLTKLDGASLIGLTRMLEVKVFYDDVKDENGKPMPRSGEVIIEDCLVKFHSLNREKRRQILRILRAAKKEK
jgi:hypothetical protein